MDYNIGEILWIFCGFLILATLWLIIRSVVQGFGTFMSSAEKNSEELEEIKESLINIEAKLKQLENK